MIITNSFLLSEKSKTKARARTLTFCLEKIRRVGVNYEQIVK